jgi:hypothetical protein
MAKQKFTHFVPRAKPRKRPGRHKKRLNKSEKRQQTFRIRKGIMKNKFKKKYELS